MLNLERKEVFKSVKRLQIDLPDFIVDMLTKLQSRYQLSIRDLVYRAIEHYFNSVFSDDVR